MKTDLLRRGGRSGLIEKWSKRKKSRIEFTMKKTFRKRLG